MPLENENSDNDFLKRLRFSLYERLTAPQEEVIAQLNNLWDTLTKKLIHSQQPAELNEEQDLKDIIVAINAWDEHYKNRADVGFDVFSKTLYEGFHTEIASLKQHCIERLQSLIPAKELSEIEKEQHHIISGLYQHQFYNFTYDLAIASSFSLNTSWSLGNQEETQVPDHNINVNIKSTPNGGRDRYEVCPIMDQPGLVCTAAIPIQIPEDNALEIQLNFFGTTDFASQKVDMEEGGPGQLTIKKYEDELIARVNTLVDELSKQYPDKQIRLRVSGHSLGGSLAKAFTYSLQKAIALQDYEPKDIIQTIEHNIFQIAPPRAPGIVQKEIEQLERELSTDVAKFKGASALKKVTGITLYSLGGPGVSKVTDQGATLMTYYHPERFIRVYNHNHELDTIPKFGDREFLSGQNGLPPRVAVHKTFTLKSPISQEEIDDSFTLPFPGCTKKVLAAHNQRIFELVEQNRGAEVVHEVTNTCDTFQVLNKEKFNIAVRACFKSLFMILNAVETIAKKIFGPDNLPSVIKSHKAADLKEFKFNSTSTVDTHNMENNFVSTFKEKLHCLQDKQNEDENEEDDFDNVWLGPQ